MVANAVARAVSTSNGVSRGLATQHAVLGILGTAKAGGITAASVKLDGDKPSMSSPLTLGSGFVGLYAATMATTSSQYLGLSVGAAGTPAARIGGAVGATAGLLMAAGAAKLGWETMQAIQS